MSAQKTLQSAIVAVSEYAGAPALMVVAGMLDVIRERYLLELVDVAPDDLAAKQAAVKQVTALRDLLRGTPNADPCI